MRLFKLDAAPTSPANLKTSRMWRHEKLELLLLIGFVMASHCSFPVAAATVIVWTPEICGAFKFALLCNYMHVSLIVWTVNIAAVIYCLLSRKLGCSIKKKNSYSNPKFRVI